MRLVTSSLTWITLTLDILLCLPGRMLNWVVQSSEVVLGERVSFPRNQPHLGPAGDPLSPRLHTLRASQCSASMLTSRAGGYTCLASDASNRQSVGRPQSPTSDSWTAPDILKGSGSQPTCRTLCTSTWGPVPDGLVTGSSAPPRLGGGEASPRGIRCPRTRPGRDPSPPTSQLRARRSASCWYPFFSISKCKTDFGQS